MFVYMAKRARPPTRSTEVPLETVQQMLMDAIEHHYDFVAAWDPRPGEEPAIGSFPTLHVMTGNLITACRLNGIRGRAILYEDEGAQIVTFPSGTVSRSRTRK